MIALEEYVKNNELSVIVKPNSKKTEITGYSEEKNAVMINVNARAEKNEANKELIKFLSKLLKRRVLIKSGETRRRKIIKLL